MRDPLEAIIYEQDCLKLLDQRQLPNEEVYVVCRNAFETAQAIRRMVVRGAPAIGIAAALGLSLGTGRIRNCDFSQFLSQVERLCRVLRESRPTAINLSWALERIWKRLLSHTERDVEASKNLVENEALHIWEEEKEANRAIIRSGQTLIQSGDRILTHCNTGPLATGGLGTALGIILEASREGKHIQAWVDETRPFLQGARLTSWELAQGKVPFRLITDSMAGYFMRRREVDIVLVGADRIAANGDVANKIGTYSLAVLAQEHEIPFYVAAPVSSFDLTRVSGDDIPIEERDPQEVTHLMGHRIAPDGIEAANPVFDITPSRYIRAFITEKGILRPPWSSLLVLPAGLGKSAGSESK